ncbi:prolyl oligopeptidase family serine peptidase [Natronospira sp.]|uniref:S9 family peptidase n=1 Tax=Natronospira sp. TaxID=2024970 RepID=UPI0038733D65
MKRLVTAFLTLSLLLMLAGPLAAKQPLDHSVYTEWQRIQEQAISRDGRWVVWSMAPEESDATLVLRAVDGDARHEVPRGDSPRFSHDSRFLALNIQPEREAIREARLEEVPAEQRPQPGLGLLDLETDELTEIDRVAEFGFPAESGDWLAWLHAPPAPDEDEDSADNDNDNDNDNDKERDDGRDPGTELVLKRLADGERRTFDHVSEFAFSADGRYLAMAVTTPDGEDDGLKLFDTRGEESRRLRSGEGEYRALTFSDDADRLAFLFRDQREDDERPDAAFALYHWAAGEDDASRIVDEESRFLADDWHVSKHRAPHFSESGERLFFGTAPAPVEMPDDDDVLEEEKVTVDVWHWQDDLLQPMQLEQLEEERKRTYLAVAHLNDDGRLVQLGREQIPEVEMAMEGDAPVFLGVSNLPYRKEISWDWPRYFDGWLIDVETGKAELILKTVQARPEISPAAGYVNWWDREQQSWFAMDLESRDVVDLGAEIDHPLGDHTNDRPFADNPQGRAGWLADDAGFILYDRHDLWLVDPANGNARSLSHEKGRERGWRYRFVDLDPDEAAIDPDAPLLLTAFDEASRDHGFHHAFVDADKAPVERLMTAHRYGRPVRAEDGEALLFTRENFQEFPDLRVAMDASFADTRRLSEVNPQQADYRWGQVELVHWDSKTGKPHDGLLFKPEDFDPEREYPMIVYFYERASEGLHSHRPPQAHRSVIIPTFYTSNDYIVFVPDVWYREGYPGDSAMESIMPKTRALAEEDWVDADRVGIQGHSWAGYKISYMVTQTDFFRAAAGGAPVSNMVSAYGGIRWRTGMSRMFQYERTQSRLGKTLWEDKSLYLHNSPIFMADQINTPLLMMHNDQDGAVPWEQGIELFVALRRLSRPAWLINYNDEPHWPTTFANREDWQIRLQQFFDHYLKDEPAPRWLESGIPALEKGATLGHESD